MEHWRASLWQTERWRPGVVAQRKRPTRWRCVSHMRAQPCTRTARAPGSKCECAQCTLITACDNPWGGGASSSPWRDDCTSPRQPSSRLGRSADTWRARRGAEAGVQNSGTGRSAEIAVSSPPQRRRQTLSRPPLRRPQRGLPAEQGAQLLHLATDGARARARCGGRGEVGAETRAPGAQRGGRRAAHRSRGLRQPVAYAPPLLRSSVLRVCPPSILLPDPPERRRRRPDPSGPQIPKPTRFLGGGSLTRGYGELWGDLLFSPPKLPFPSLSKPDVTFAKLLDFNL